MQTKVYQAIAAAIFARQNCADGKNPEWFNRHKENADQLTRDMDDAGFYDGWTHHTVTVRASLVFGINVSVSGRDRNGIKEYIGEAFHAALCCTVIGE